MTRESIIGLVLGAVCILAVVNGCGSGGGGPRGGVTATSTLCPGLSGFEALAWDYYNGVIVTNPVLPPPVPVGAVFGHPDFPLLGFSHDASWSSQLLRDAQTQGVNLFRNDNQALWRLVFTTVTGTPDVRTVRDTEIQAILNFYGFNGTADQIATVCVNEASGELSPGTGIFAAASNIMIRTPGHTAIVTAQVTPFPGGLNSSSITVRAMAAPTAEFGDRAFDSFMAIDWQMLIADTTNSDRDFDGWLDQFDRAPDDPLVH